MGKIANFFGLLFPKPKKTEEKSAPSVSRDIAFVTDSEAQEYEFGIMGQLLDQKTKIDFITKYLPKNGANLKQQSEALINLLNATNNDQDPDVIHAFSDYLEMFHADYRRAVGLSVIEELESINSCMSTTFTQSRMESHLDKEMIMSYVSAIQALRDKVDAEKEKRKPILTGPSNQYYTAISLEAEYRLKMLELLYITSIDEGLMHRDKSNVVNPFEKLTPVQKSRFATLFRNDLDAVAVDYRLLSGNEDVLNRYARHNFTRIDPDAEKLNIKLGTQELRDYTFETMFGGEVPSDELFENIKSLIYIRYNLNEMKYEQPQAQEAKQKREEQERKDKEKAERRKKEEEEREAQRAEEERVRKQRAEEAKRKAKEQEEEAARLAKAKAEEEAKKLVDATDEEIQARINELYHDVTLTGSRYINILDFQKRIAVAKGLIPTNDMMQDENLVYCVYSPQEIIRFIKHVNKSGVHYYVFPDSQEGDNGGFNVVVSKSDQGILDIHSVNNIFGSSQRSYIRGDDARVWKRFGTIPAYYLEKIMELYNESDDEKKEEYKDFIFVDKAKVKDSYEIGVMTTCYKDGSPSEERFLTDLILEAYRQLKKQWQDKHEDRDVLSYVSVPATCNIIPLLRAFKEKGVTPYFERVPLTGKRNTDDRDNIHIYFSRDEYEKFWNEVRPSFVEAASGQMVPMEVHYGADYDFVAENPSGLKLKLLKDIEQTEQEH